MPLMSHIANIALFPLNFITALPDHLMRPKHEREVGNLRYMETMQLLLEVRKVVCETSMKGFIGPGPIKL